MQPKLSIHSRGTARGFMRAALRGVLADDTRQIAGALAEQDNPAGLCTKACMYKGGYAADLTVQSNEAAQE